MVLTHSVSVAVIDSLLSHPPDYVWACGVHTSHQSMADETQHNLTWWCLWWLCVAAVLVFQLNLWIAPGSNGSEQRDFLSLELSLVLLSSWKVQYSVKARCFTQPGVVFPSIYLYLAFCRFVLVWIHTHTHTVLGHWRWKTPAGVKIFRTVVISREKSVAAVCV